MPVDYQIELETTREIILESGRYLHDFFYRIRRGEITDVEIALMAKGGHKDYSTGPDRESERMILTRLREAFPEMPVLAEETQSGVLFPKGEGIAVDPLDGTRRFRNGIEEYSTAISRFVDGTVKWAIVYAPSASNAGFPAEHTGELFEGIRGEGVTLNGKPLVKLNPEKKLRESLIAIGWNYQTDPDYFKRDVLRSAPVIHGSSDASRGGSGAYDTCKVAAGRFGSYYEQSWGDPWSLSGGLMFVEEMDGVVSDYDGRPINLFKKTYDSEKQKERFDIQWVASKNRKIHEEVLRLLKIAA